jgi:copper chaperone NosL
MRIGHHMTKQSRLLLTFGALLLSLVYVLPLWHISLDAPQYPEGLGLYIAVDRIVGEKPQDLTSINNLNHYIGMKKITPEDIPELRFMPLVLGGLILAGVVAAAIGRRGLLLGWTVLFALGAAAGLADFWKWGYDYGHDLDPHAILKIPGMSYQPPVLGVRKLLNFTASSWPASGGWIAIAVLILAVVLSVREFRRARRVKDHAAPREAALAAVVV